METHRGLILLLCVGLSCCGNGTGDQSAAEVDVSTEDVQDSSDVTADTVVADTLLPDTLLPDTRVQDTQVQDTQTQDTQVQETEKPDTTDVSPEDTTADTAQGKSDGEPCSDHSVCLSNNCRKAPSGSSQCTPADKPCADGLGGGLATGEKLCVDDNSYTCTAEDNFEVMTCEQSCGYYMDVSGCSAGECAVCATSCTASSECDDGATCDNGACVAGAQGVPCDSNSDCPTDNCRTAPDGTKRCAPPGAECSDGTGGGLAVNDGICYSGDVITCQAGGTFGPPQDCAKDCGLYANVDGCAAGTCQACPTVCGDDSNCKPEGYCDGSNVCVSLPITLHPGNHCHSEHPIGSRDLA